MSVGPVGICANSSTKLGIVPILDEVVRVKGSTGVGVWSRILFVLFDSIHVVVKDKDYGVMPLSSRSCQTSWAILEATITNNNKNLFVGQGLFDAHGCTSRPSDREPEGISKKAILSNGNSLLNVVHNNCGIYD